MKKAAGTTIGKGAARVAGPLGAIIEAIWPTNWPPGELSHCPGAPQDPRCRDYLVKQDDRGATQPESSPSPRKSESRRIPTTSASRSSHQ